MVWLDLFSLTKSIGLIHQLNTDILGYYANR